MLEGLSAVLVVPTYGTVDPECARSVRVAMMHAAQYGLSWLGDSSPDRLPYGCARNTAVQHVLDTEGPMPDGIMWIDSDILVPSTGITRLLSDVRFFKAEFASGVYHQRAPLHNPVFYSYNAKRKVFQPAEEYPLDTFAPVAGCGFGFVWTSTKLLVDISNLKDFDRLAGGWFPDKRDAGGFGEDLSFCDMARKAKHQLYIDTGVIVGHMSAPYIVTRDDFLRERAKWIEETGGVHDTRHDKWGIGGTIKKGSSAA